MTVREIIAPELHVLGTAKLTMSSATTTSFDFGTPDDINLAAITSTQPGYAFDHGDRVLLVLTASTAGTTDTLTFVVQDAPDSSGSIGTPATALTTVNSGTLVVGTGGGFRVVSVQLQAGRPWLRVRATSSGATDTIVCHCTVLGFPATV